MYLNIHVLKYGNDAGIGKARAKCLPAMAGEGWHTVMIYASILWYCTVFWGITRRWGPRWRLPPVAEHPLSIPIGPAAALVDVKDSKSPLYDRRRRTHGGANFNSHQHSRLLLGMV